MNSLLGSCLKAMETSLVLDFLFYFPWGCFSFMPFVLNAFYADILYIKLSSCTLDYLMQNLSKLSDGWLLTPATIKSQTSPFKSLSFIHRNFLFLNKNSNQFSNTICASFYFNYKPNSVSVNEKRQLTLMFWMT